MIESSFSLLEMAGVSAYGPEAYWGYGWAINGTKHDGGDLLSAEAHSHWGAAGPFICVDSFNNTVLAAITDL